MNLYFTLEPPSHARIHGGGTMQPSFDTPLHQDMGGYNASSKLTVIAVYPSLSLQYIRQSINQQVNQSYIYHKHIYKNQINADKNTIHGS